MKMLNNKGSICIFIVLTIAFGSWFGWAISRVETQPTLLEPKPVLNKVDVEHVFTWVYNRIKYDKPYEIPSVTVLSPEAYAASYKAMAMAVDYPGWVERDGEEKAKEFVEFYSKCSTGFFTHQDKVAITIKDKFDICENNGILVSLTAQYFWHIFEKPNNWDEYHQGQKDGIRSSIAFLASVLQEEYCDTFCKEIVSIEED